MIATLQLYYSKMSRFLNLSSFVRSVNTSALRNTSPNVISLKPGDHLYNYTVTRVVPINEFDLTAVQLVHKTGAEHLHISRKDSDNVFAVALCTTPRDSTGVPHILEHVSLCGSEKFPVRDPFIKMYNRSLSTFMNAFTASDWTMYPFSSQNPKDFENLLAVYLDAVFHPRLRQTDFNQEGWRLEHEKVDDANTPIVLKGVVYNEMKGVFSDPHQVYSQAAQNLLYPSGTYGVVSGGDPKCIPDLTWKQLKAFHQHHYHPSNSRFFTYGDLPLERHLELINKTTLSKFHHEPVETLVPPEIRWSSPKVAHISCPVDCLNPDPQKGSIVSVNHLLCDVTDLQESFDVSLLCNLLVDGEKAPFYQAFISSGLGSDYSPGTGYNNRMRDTSFSVGLQRVNKSDVDKVVEIVERTIDKVIEEGFEERRIEALLHKIELSLKHQSERFGLNFVLSLIPAWIHGADPVHLLQVERHVEELKRRLALNPGYLQDLAKKYFKDNQHKLILISEPDSDYLEKSKKLEAERLEAMVSSLSDVKKKEIYTNGLELARIQSTPEDLSCLPSLQISDVPLDHDRVAVERILLDRNKDKSKTHTEKVKVRSTIAVQTCIQPTNGVVYLNMVCDVSRLPYGLEKYLPLFCHIMTKMGAGGMDYRQQSEMIDLKTGGLQVTPLVTHHPSEPRASQRSIAFSSYCLERNLKDMFKIWSDIFVSLSLTDHDRFFTLLTSVAAEGASELLSSGHRFAMSYSALNLDYTFEYKENLEGVSQLELIKKLVSHVSSPEKYPSLPFDPEMVDRLLWTIKRIAEYALLSSARPMRASLIARGDVMDTALQGLERFHIDLDTCGIAETPKEYHFRGGDYFSTTNDIVYYSYDTSFNRKVHLQFPLQYNHIGKSFLTVPFAHPHYAPLHVLGKILSSKFLHREIREMGGAYGGGAEASPNAFQFFSYRDPNLLKTLESFTKSIDWAINGKFTDQDVNEAKLSVFSSVDRPISPGNQGLRLFLRGITEDQFAEFRQRIKDTTKDQIISVAQIYLTDAKKGGVTVIGPKNESTGSENSGWEVVLEGSNDPPHRW